MLQIVSAWRAVILVGLVLGAAFAITGTVSSAYKKERVSLGQTHYGNGQALAQKGRMDDAIEEYRKALLFLPDDTQYRLSLASALLNAGRLDEAEAHLEQLSEEEPTNPLIYLALARIAARRHRVNRAIQQYQRCVYEYWPPSMIPLRRSARWELVSLLTSHGRSNEAVGELMQLYASAPPDPRERERIGFLLVQFGANSEATQVFRDLVREHPQDGVAHRGLAQLAFTNADYVTARHEFQRALHFNPTDGQSAHDLAETNEVIDIDPALAGISQPERLRRSQNLMRRVLDDLGPCGTDNPEPTPFNTQFEAAEKLLTAKRRTSEDPALDLQTAAQKLWQQRSAACGKHPPVNEPVDLVMARLASE